MTWLALLASAFAQAGELDPSDPEKALILGGFAAGVVGIFLFLARDIIFGKKTEYDGEKLDSKRDRTYEKYHSGWGDDYEELGRRSGKAKEWRRGQMPNYYGTLGLERGATPAEIKARFRELAKKNHPDRAGKPERMAEINEAYEALSDARSKKRYDSMLDP